MADTIRKTEEEKKEYFDSEDVLDQKIEKLAQLVRESNHFIAFTGAGISTACGIPDFRSGVGTVLKTGPGAWEKRAHNLPNAPNKNVVEMAKAIPSLTHMALVQLEKQGFLKYLISQNTDGLHLRSGFNPDKLAELHGNRCLQKCKNCKSKFLRDFRTREAQKVHEHETSRRCEECQGKLYDSIINFGQNLPEEEIGRSFDEGGKADLCLAMGSSLTVTPAADIPKLVGKRQKLVIVNLQITPLDNVAYLRINAMCDDVMRRLAAKLKMEVPPFALERHIQFEINKEQILQFRGVSKNGVPFSFLKEVGIKTATDKRHRPIKGQPYRAKIPEDQGFEVLLTFYGYMGEPPYALLIDKPIRGEVRLVYAPELGKWVSESWTQTNAKSPMKNVKS